MAAQTMQELISAYIDHELGESKRREVEKLIKTDKQWKAEYESMVKTADMLSRLDRLAVPGDMVRKVSTSISLTKKGFFSNMNDKLMFTMTRAPLLQYMALVFALVFIVFAASVSILRHNKEEQDALTLALKDPEVMEDIAERMDKELVEKGFTWMHIKITDDGEFSVEHIGQSPPRAEGEKDKALERKEKSRPSPLEDLQGLGYIDSKEADDSKPAPREAPEPAVTEAEDRIEPPSKSNKLEEAGKKEQQEKNAQAAPRSLEKGKQSIARAESAERSYSAPEREKAKSGEEGFGLSSAVAQKPRERQKDKAPAAAGAAPRRSQKRDISNTKIEPGDESISSDEEQIRPATDVIPPRLLSMPPLSISEMKHISRKTVTLLLHIDTDGRVVETAIIRGTGNPKADQRLLHHVRKAEFRPAFSNGKPVLYALVLNMEIQ